MDRLWLVRNPWNANRKVIAELQREREVRDGPVVPLHTDKPAGTEVFVENAGRMLEG